MPAWNAALYVANALGSLLAQRDAAELDIIVADDGSTDTTRDVVRGLDAAEVRLLELPHRGVSAARNAALEVLATDTEAVTFLDADDLSPPGRFARDLRTLEDQQVDVVWGMTQRFFEPEAAAEAATFSNPPPLERGTLLGNLLVRMDLIRRIGSFDETLATGEDSDFVLRLLELEPRIHTSSDVALLYRRHVANLTDGGGERNAIARVYMLAARRRRGRPPLPIPQGLFVGASRRGNE